MRVNVDVNVAMTAEPRAREGRVVLVAWLSARRVELAARLHIQGGTGVVPGLSVDAGH